MGGVRVLPSVVIGGEAAVDQQREFRDRRLDSAGLKQNTAAGEHRYPAVLLLLAVCGDTMMMSQSFKQLKAIVTCCLLNS